MKRFLNAVWHYWFYRLRALWIGMLFPIALGGLAYYTAILGATQEVGLQRASIALQFFGLILVARGYLDLRSHFGRRPVGESVSTFLQDFWKSARGSPVTVQPLTGHIRAGGRVTGRGRVGPGSQATLEERVALLERNYTSLHDEIGSIDRESRRRDEELEVRVSGQAVQLEKQIAEHRALLERVTIGGLGEEVIGWAWLLGSSALSAVATSA